MAKMKCVISYDGSNFAGLQTQPGRRTIQGELEKVLKKIHKGELVRVHASGRTDKGVHAVAQTMHFETNLRLQPRDWKQALNAMLDNDLHVSHVVHVPESFHARFDVIEKEYHYIVYRNKEADVFKRNYACHFPYPLDMTRVQEACTQLEGTHDFTTFSSAKSEAKGSKVRTLYEVSFQDKGPEIEFVFRGSGFLYKMVRILMGTILDIGQGRMEAADIPTLFEKKDRRLASRTAPPEGLYLWNVVYED